MGNYLCISDTQAPFHNKGAVNFLKRVQKEFKIPKTNIIHVGDECDFYHLSRFPKNPDMRLSAVDEYDRTIDFMKQMYSAFPIVRVCESNHGKRPLRRLLESFVPSVYAKSYRELLEAPNGWQWKPYWKINEKHRFLAEHGHKLKGAMPYLKALSKNGISTVFGHHHSSAGIIYRETEHLGPLWSFNVGSLIDRDALAFEYDKDNEFQPCLGTGVILDHGKRPLWIPYEK